MIRVHGSSVSLGGHGILLQGPSGSGKSDLALRLIDQGARLVADDQTELRLVGEELCMTSPAAIVGQLEVRGVGILHVPTVPTAPLRLVVGLVPAERIERLPEPQFCTFLGRDIPFVSLAPFEASATAKLNFALRACATPAPSAPSAVS